MPRITRPQVYRVVREMLPKQRLGPAELLRWLEDVQLRNGRASRSHAKRRAARLLGSPPLAHSGPLPEVVELYLADGRHESEGLHVDGVQVGPSSPRRRVHCVFGKEVAEWSGHPLVKQDLQGCPPRLPLSGNRPRAAMRP